MEKQQFNHESDIFLDAIGIGRKRADELEKVSAEATGDKMSNDLEFIHNREDLTLAEKMYCACQLGAKMFACSPMGILASLGGGDFEEEEG